MQHCIGCKKELYKKDQNSKFGIPIHDENEPKIRAIIHTANHVLLIQKKHQSFANFLWHFNNNESLNYDYNPDFLIPPLQFATTVSIALKNEGFKFVGPKTVLSFLHMVGII